MHVVVTGAAGLIGSHLVDILLERGHSVTGVDNLSFGSSDNLKNALDNYPETFYFILSNVSYMSSFHKIFLKGCDMIVHLASYKKPHGDELKANDVIMDNIDMTYNITKVAASANIPLIFTSTSDVYNNSDTFEEDAPVCIGPPTSPRYSYAMSKLISEQLIMNGITQNNLKAAIFRIFGCASKRSRMSWSGGHIPLFIKNASEGKPITIHGDGSQTRSMSHAIDIARGIADGVENFNKIEGEILNIGTSEETTVKEVAEYISKAYGGTSIEYIDPPKNYIEIKRRWANTKKAERLLDFKITYSTKQVIDEIINHVNNEYS